MKIITSGLPIFIDEKTNDLEFLDGLSCAGALRNKPDN